MKIINMKNIFLKPWIRKCKMQNAKSGFQIKKNLSVLRLRVILMCESKASGTNSVIGIPKDRSYTKWE